MNDVRQRFRYSLESLLKKRRADRDQLLLEVHRTQGLLHAKAMELEESIGIVRELEERIRSAQSAVENIDADRLGALNSYLKVHRQDVESRTAQKNQLEAIYQRLMEQIKNIRQSIKGLEKNRTYHERRFQAAQQAANYLELDNLWLTRRREQ